MYGGQEKMLGQKVNVKFFTVDPYSVGTGVPRPFSKFANYWKNIFLTIKTSKIKSEKNVYQTIHNTRFIFDFFGIFTIFLYFSRIFTKKCIFSEKIIVGPNGVPDPPSLAQMTFTQCTSMSELEIDPGAPPGGQI